MPLDLSDTLVVGISATALFDMDAEAKIFLSKGVRTYREHMVAREKEPFAHGAGFPVVQALLSLNRNLPAGTPPLVEVLVMSRNSPETSVAVMNSVRHYGLGITRYAFTGGEPLASYVEPLGVDLFLSTHKEDVQRVADAGRCACALLYPPPPGYVPPRDQVRFAFDADAVLFHEASEVTYKTRGLPAFHAAEDAARDEPMGDGPFARFLRKLSKLKKAHPAGEEYSPLRIAIVTARNAPAEARVITTLRAWQVYVDEAFFLGGIEKRSVLEAFRPHIFFDDQEMHAHPASSVVPAALVPYASTSPLNRAAVIARDNDAGPVPIMCSPADGPNQTTN